MTTIAWDGKTLSGDRMMTNGSRKFYSRKVFKKCDLLFGICGEISGCYQIMEDIIREIGTGIEFNSGKQVRTIYPIKTPKEVLSESEVLVVTRSGDVFHYSSHSIPCLVNNRDNDTYRSFAIGSGSHYVISALFLGKSSSEAIQICSLFDPTTCPYTDSITFDDKDVWFDIPCITNG